MYDLKMTKARIDEEYEKRRVILAKAFDMLSVGTKLQSDSHTAVCRKTLKIEYDIEKLEKAGLERELLDKIIEKEILIIDYPEVVKWLKKAGVQAADFKQLIEVRKEVNKEVVKNLFDTEQLKLDDIEGCYYAQIVKSIIIS